MPSSDTSQYLISPSIVVGGVAFGDRSRVVRLLTKEHGLVPVWVANATKNMAFWHPMAVLEMVDLRQRRSGGLWTFRECRRGASQIAYRREPARSAVGFFVAEVLSGCLEEGAPAPDLYDLSMRSVDWLESQPRVPLIHVKFMAELVHTLGLLPASCPPDKTHFDIVMGEYVSSELAPKHAMTSVTVSGMRDIVGMDFGVVEQLNWTRNERKELVLGAHRYVQSQLGKSGELKSYDVLEALFS